MVKIKRCHNVKEITHQERRRKEGGREEKKAKERKKEREEGRKKGRKEGRKEGREKGRKKSEDGKFGGIPDAMGIEQGSADFLCEEPYSTYFRLCGPSVSVATTPLCCVAWKQT